MAGSSLTFEEEDWRQFLQDWSDEVLGLLAQIEPQHRNDLTICSLLKTSLLQAPATVEVIASLERRLGVLLPESYKRFLLASNGFPILGHDAQDGLLRSAEALGWLKDNEPEFVAGWGRSFSGIPDDVYFDYGPDQDTINVRTEYVSSTLQISDFIDSAVVLLNPQVVDARGEWEAWDFGNEFPGAYRYRSFEELMVGLRARTTANLRQTIAFIPMLAARRT